MFIQGLDECRYLHPGQIAFTRMRWGAQSKAAALVKPSTACFDAQYATVLESVSGAGTLKRCLSKTTCSTISRSRRLTVNARKVYYPASVAVWQRILSHHLSSGSAAAVHDSCRIHTHGGGPVGIWHRPDRLWVLDLGRYTSGVYDAVHCLRVVDISNDEVEYSHVEPSVRLSCFGNKSTCTCSIAHVCLMEQSLTTLAHYSIDSGSYDLSRRIQVCDNDQSTFLCIG
jgi:hypothetical protein